LNGSTLARHTSVQKKNCVGFLSYAFFGQNARHIRLATGY
jgi:hypothetical protein